MKNQDSQILGPLFIILIVAGIFYFFGDFQNKNNPTIDVKTDTTIKVSSVEVGTFYDGKNGYSLSIPSGNSSSCIWTYTGGNAAIPYSITTQAISATEKHTVHSYDFYNWKVFCVDDFGNLYVGIFPTIK